MASLNFRVGIIYALLFKKIWEQLLHDRAVYNSRANGDDGLLKVRL